MHANLNKSMSPIFPIQKGFQQLYRLSIEHKTHTYTTQYTFYFLCWIVNSEYIYTIPEPEVEVFNALVLSRYTSRIVI